MVKSLKDTQIYHPRMLLAVKSFCSFDKSSDCFKDLSVMIIINIFRTVEHDGDHQILPYGR